MTPNWRRQRCGHLSCRASRSFVEPQRKADERSSRIWRNGPEIATGPRSSIIGTAIRSRRGRAPRSWGVARIDPEIGSYAIIQFKKLPLCEVAHTPPGIGDLYAGRLPAAAAWSVPLEGAVPRTNLWSNSVPRVELDQRSREASRRLKQIERLFKPPVRVRHSRLLRLIYVLSLGTCSAMPQ